LFLTTPAHHRIINETIILARQHTQPPATRNRRFRLWKCKQTAEAHVRAPSAGGSQRMSAAAATRRPSSATLCPALGRTSVADGGTSQLTCEKYRTTGTNAPFAQTRVVPTALGIALSIT
jgi:hypothetical protein